MTITLASERQALLETIDLRLGGHRSFEEGVCAMEMVAYLANEPHSDHPQCACPVITRFMVSWNDSLPSNEERNRLLKPLLPKVIGTRSTTATEERRGWMAFDWLIRVHTPAWLALAGLKEDAAALRALPELTRPEQLSTIAVVVERARERAATARATAWATAGAAAWAAAWAAARATAGAAAWAAAWAAARATAGAALAETKATLQASAVELVERMCALSEVS